MSPYKPRDTAGLEMNRLWKQQQARLHPLQQNVMAEPRQGHTEPETPAVIHPTTPEPAGETPQECRECTVSKECKAILKLWYKKKPRPVLARAWCAFFDAKALQCVCLSKTTTRFSLRDLK